MGFGLGEADCGLSTRAKPVGVLRFLLLVTEFRESSMAILCKGQGCGLLLYPFFESRFSLLLHPF